MKIEIFFSEIGENLKLRGNASLSPGGWTPLAIGLHKQLALSY